MSNNKSMRFWRTLSEQNKVYFWSIFTTGLVGFFSLWLGIAIQDDINTKNARETQKLARYQMVQAVYPKFSEYIDAGEMAFFDLWEIYNSPKTEVDKDNTAHILRHYYEVNKNDFAEAMKNSVNFMCDSRYYFNRKSQRRICANNTSILFGLRLLERNNSFLLYTFEKWSNCVSLSDSIAARINNPYYAKNIFSYKEESIEEISEKVEKLLHNSTTIDSTENIENTLYNFIFLPYIDNFNVYQNELMPEDDIESHIWKHLLILFLCILISCCFCVYLLAYVFKPLSEASTVLEKTNKGE